jgi:hypothetical protein
LGNLAETPEIATFWLINCRRLQQSSSLKKAPWLLLSGIYAENFVQIGPAVIAKLYVKTPDLDLG